MRDSVKGQPFMANASGDNDLKSTESPKYIASPLRTRFADDSGIHDTHDQEMDVKTAHSKHVLRQTPSNTSQTTNSVVSPKRTVNTQKSNNTIPSSVEFKTSTIRQHYYPEGGWGWVVVGCVVFSYVITFGLQLSYGVFLYYLIRQPFGSDKFMSAVWLGSLSLGLSYLISPVIVSWCRRKSARLTAIAGGLMASLGCLFASFASQFHQVFLSYGIFLSIGVGIARESANLMVGQYFKRRRYFVEIFVQSSLGVGIAFMTPFLSWSIGIFKHWRAGLQLITCALFATFLIAVLYRPASLYHPQRRAILHLKTQRRKIREKNPVNNKPPFFDLTPLKAKSLQLILVSTCLFSFGYLSPLFYWVNIVDESARGTVVIKGSPVPSGVIFRHMYFGVCLIIGVVIVGYLTVSRRFKNRVNKQYLCQISMFATVLALISNMYYYESAFMDVISIAMYGMAIGAFNYSHKMLVYSIIRAKNFGKAWSYVQFVQSFSIFLGVPISGHINVWCGADTTPYYGFLFASVMCLSGTLLLLALNPEFKSLSQNLSDKLHELHHHSCNASSDIQHLNAVTSPNPAINYSRSSDSGVQSHQDTSHCCNCGQRLLSIDDNNEPFKEYHSMKAADEMLRSPTLRADPLLNESDDDEDEEDEEFRDLKLQNPEFIATYMSDDMYNYYLRGDVEEGVALFDPNKDKMIANDVDCLHGRQHLMSSCDTSDDKVLKPLKRTIETVAEETSSGS